MNEQTIDESLFVISNDLVDFVNFQFETLNFFTLIKDDLSEYDLRYYLSSSFDAFKKTNTYKKNYFEEYKIPFEWFYILVDLGDYFNSNGLDEFEKDIQELCCKSHEDIIFTIAKSRIISILKDTKERDNYNDILTFLKDITKLKLDYDLVVEE